MSIGLLGLPVELLLLVLTYAFGDYFDSPGFFVFNRSTARLVCRQLYFLVSNSPDFWSSYLIKPGKLFVELAEWERRFQQRDLHLRLRLDNVDVRWRQPGRASFEETIAFFLKHAPACRIISMAADDARTLPVLIRHIQPIWFQRLRSFTLIRFAAIHHLRSPLREPVDCPFVGSPHITRLQLFGTVFHWRHMARFTGITILALHDLHRLLSPSPAQLLAVLSANPGLVKVSLRLGTAATHPRVPSPNGAHRPSSFPPVVLPCLTDLDLSPYGDQLLSVVLAVVDFPSLEVLSFTFARRIDVHSLLSMKSCISRVTKFIAHGYNYEVPAIYDLFLRMPAVRDLEISEFNSEVAGALLYQKSPIFKLLTTLTLEEVPSEDLREIVSRRIGLGVPLQHLSVSYPYHEVLDEGCTTGEAKAELEDISWLRDHLLALEMNPSFCDPLGWIRK
ncbi:hypothetical protein DFH06DRAFT_1145104 [Mycena polygramma]|nr:hypothetical protein DFH06DRAFT_1145104 [Mycena polygramma]